MAMRNALLMVNRDGDGHGFEFFADPVRAPRVECVRCHEWIDVEHMTPQQVTRGLLELGPCRGAPLGDRVWFEYRRPTLRELLQKGRP